MKRLALCAATFFAICGSADAQTSEVGLMAGFTPSVGLEKQAPQINETKIAGGFTWALQGAHFFSPHWGVEVQWSQQSSRFEIATPAGSAILYAVAVGDLQGGAVYQFGADGAKLRPFVFGGLGATSFRAYDLRAETKLSYGIGGGLKYFRWKDVGLRAQFRYKPTRLNDEPSGNFCDPFGFCQATLQQIDVLAGVLLRF